MERFTTRYKFRQNTDEETPSVVIKRPYFINNMLTGGHHKCVYLAAFDHLFSGVSTLTLSGYDWVVYKIYAENEDCSFSRNNRFALEFKVRLILRNVYNFF